MSEPNDCPPHNLDEAAEQCYRRGFDQGVAAALEAATMYSRYELDEWKRRLSAWRRQSCKKIVFPEWLGRR